MTPADELQTAARAIQDSLTQYRIAQGLAKYAGLAVAPFSSFNALGFQCSNVAEAVMHWLDMTAESFRMFNVSDSGGETALALWVDGPHYGMGDFRITEWWAALCCARTINGGRP